MSEFVFVLTQKAKSKGGDKYVCETDENFNIYLPQTTSRPDSKEPLQKVVITVTKFETKYKD
jgi:hypothetical protein